MLATASGSCVFVWRTVWIWGVRLGLGRGVHPCHFENTAKILGRTVLAKCTEATRSEPILINRRASFEIQELCPSKVLSSMSNARVLSLQAAPVSQSHWKRQLLTNKRLKMVRARSACLYKSCNLVSEILTTLAFWLRSSVVSVLNSLTTIMGAPPPLLVI